MKLTHSRGFTESFQMTYCTSKYYGLKIDTRYCLKGLNFEVDMVTIASLQVLQLVCWVWFDRIILLLIALNSIGLGTKTRNGEISRRSPQKVDK